MLDPERVVELNRLVTVGRVVPGVSHDLNNSLQIIGGMIEMLCARDGLDPQVTSKLERIAVHAGRAAGLVAALAAVARSEPRDLVRLSLRQVVEETMALRRHAVSRARIVFSVEAPEGDPLDIHVAGGELQQVLLNLVFQAEQGVAGASAPEIKIVLERRQDAVRLTVADNGADRVGEIQERLCESSAALPEHVAGFGLTAANWIAQHRGWRLSCDAAPTGGTRLVLELPEG
jgi:C4-dicarboxylate-specific signal transduction histidine kinase